MDFSVPYAKSYTMENSNQSVTHPAPLTSQGYTHQMQPAMWSGNKVCQSNSNQNANIDPYSQQMNHYYQAPYAAQNSNEMNRYLPPVSKDQNSNAVAYSSQYPVTRQNNYSCTNPSPNYPMAMKNNCSNMYYGNVNASKTYPLNSMVQPKKYPSSSLGLSQAPQAVPQSAQISHSTGTPMPQMPNYGDQNNYIQNMYVNNCNTHTSGDQTFMMRQTMSSSSMLSSQETASIQTASMVQANQVSQVSSIPTPPETSSLPGDSMPMLDNASPDGSTDSVKMNISSASFVLPGSSISHMPSNMPSPVSSIANNSTLPSRNAGVSLQPPANLDEGSQASSASASSSIPDDQNSAKTNSKPNFSYPPTPNTLSSPGAASMSSFHDDLECISSPGWPKTPASPVANSNYEFANIKRPENLLKLYTLSDEPDRRYFLDKLIVFNEDRGSPITQCPTISKQPLDVFRVYLTVKERGGFVEVTNAKRWKDIAGAIGVGASSSAAYTLRKQYMKLLLPFECKFDRGGIDPQPIINMVEASSRKKGKNVSGVYGNPNPYNQGYSQAMDRYHSGYPASYQSSRYPCNNMEYQCSSNSVHYPQPAAHTAPPSAVSNQSQYNQYSHSHNSLSNYGYYQGTNSTSSQIYNSNLQSSASNNICRYGNNVTSSTVPQEQGYYSQQYSSSQQGHIVHENSYGSNRGCSAQENLISPSTNQITNDHEQSTSYPKVSSVVNGPSVTVSDNTVPHPKPVPESFGNMTVNCASMSSSNIESCQDSKAYCSNYNVSKVVTSDQTPLVNATCTPKPATTPTYQQPISESMVNKTPELNYYTPSQASHPANSYSNQNQNSYMNQNSFSSQKLHYQGDYQSKDQVQSTQFGQYSETQNESYRGSEGPPGVQVDRVRSLPVGDSSNTKVYPFNSNTAKVNAYNYGVQQGPTKDVYSSPTYNSQYNSSQQRAWHPEQNQYSYQPHAGPRMPLKSQLNSTDVKVNPESPRMRKPWLNSRDSAQVQSKLQNIPPPVPVQNQSIPTSKPQVHPNSMTVSQAFQSMVKRPLEFPPNTVESIKPVAVKRRRCPAKRLGSMDPWRIMLALKSGLLAESTWALDALSILLADNNTVVYFGLSHLPGLLNVLVDHYRCFLNKIFLLANDVEIAQPEILSKSKISNDLSYLSFNDVSDCENKVKILDTANFTYRTRCKKKVEIQYDEALFLIDPQRSWDKYEGFDISSEHWQKGGGDITAHIQTSFDSCSKKIKFHRELINEDKSKPKNNKVTSIKSLKPVLGSKSNTNTSSIISKGEPIVVLQKFNFLANKISTSVIESEAELVGSDSVVTFNTSIIKKSFENITIKTEDEKDPVDTDEALNNAFDKDMCKSESSISNDNACESSNASEIKQNKFKTEDSGDLGKSQHINYGEKSENSPRLRGSLSSRKRFLCEDLEDEAYCFDQPALCVVSDSQEMLSRRCVCVSTILRNLSFVPGNDSLISKNSGVLLLLGRLLLLHHEHKPAKNAYRKYEKEIDGNVSWNESCISLKDEHEWWWGTLSVLRDNTLVTLSNISGQLDLAPFPEEVSLPILDGLLHWIVCPSSYAQDPLPSRSPSSVLSPQRLSLEALCKLSVLSSNVDLIIATPPWSRIENLFAFLTKSLSHGQDQIMREFALILLSNISQADSVAARTIAEQSHSISYLIAFIEEAEANAFQIAVSQGTKKLRDKPELMGTTPGMVQRAANTLKNLALVPENQGLFMRFQARLLSLVMSQVMDQELATIIADVLFYCSEDVMGDISNQLPIS